MDQRMPKQRERICLEAGLKLDLNRLQRRGVVRPGSRTGPTAHYWGNLYAGEILRATISANMEDGSVGWFRIQLGSLDQSIVLIAKPRHFGGRQWYFSCPVTKGRVSVLWKPPGATKFCSRQALGSQFAYASQFETPVDRAGRGKAKIKARLIGKLDPDEWDLPPKPKGMRWSTYKRYEEKYDHYESVLDERVFTVVARLLGRG
jgi:hypothetical protein